MLRYSTLLSSSGETNLAIRDAFYFISSLFPLSRHVMLHAPSSSFLPGVRDHATTPKFKLCLVVFPRRVVGVATRGTRLDKSDTSERRRRRGKPFTGGSTKSKVGKGPTNNIHPPLMLSGLLPRAAEHRTSIHLALFWCVVVVKAFSPRHPAWPRMPNDILKNSGSAAPPHSFVIKPRHVAYGAKRRFFNAHSLAANKKRFGCNLQ